MAGSTRRSAILESAVGEFSALGYHGARIERIAGSARANKQLIFHYFGSKDGLYEAVVAKLLPAPDTSAAVGATPLDALKHRILDIGTWLATNPGAARALTECVPGGEMPAGAVFSARQWLERQAAGLSSVIEEGQRMGFFRDASDAQSVADLALASLVGLAVTARSGPSANGMQTTVAQMVADYCAWR